MWDKSGGGSSEDNIINIKKHVDMVRTRVICEQGAIRTTSDKTDGRKEDSKMLIPGSRDLFETIHSLTKATKIMRKSGINVSMRLFHVNLFIEDTMQKSIFDI